jgi:hypothetical protein
MNELKRLALLLIGGVIITCGVLIYVQRAGEPRATTAFEVPTEPSPGAFFASRPSKAKERPSPVARAD